MSLTEGLLLIVIIMLAFIYIMTTTGQSGKTYDCIDRSNGSLVTFNTGVASGTPDGGMPGNMPGSEMAAAPDSASGEMFSSGCSLDNMLSSCSDGEHTYALHDFGKAGLDYQDYLAERTIDPKFKENHKEFVSDRMQNNNSTGRTFALGEIEGADQVPWQGIRGRPQAIPDSARLGSLQVPDVDPNAFTHKLKHLRQ